MHLKPFEAGRYDDATVAIRNPSTGRQEFFTEEEFEFVKFIKQNESESLLALLLPNIGIAKKDHIVMCLKILSKLKRMGIVDYFGITGLRPSSETATLELPIERQKIRFEGLQALAAVLLGFSEKALAKLGPSGILLFNFFMATLSLVFFPFSRLEGVFQSQPLNYWAGIGIVYLVGVLCLIWRPLWQAAFVASLERGVHRPYFQFFFPFFGLAVDTEEVNLAGFRARLQMGFLGLLSPLALSAAFTVLGLTGYLPLTVSFLGFATCVGAALIFACPFFGYDAADILHIFLLRDEVKERISGGLRKIFQTKGSLSREMLYGLVATFVWLLLWLDSLRGFWEVIVTPVVASVTTPIHFLDQAGGFVVTVVVFLLLIMPVFIFVDGFVREKFFTRRKRIVLKNNEIKESLSFEERMAALERIPLFSYLNDQERLALLNEMQPKFYDHKEYMVHQGEVGAEFFVLVKGRANAYFTDLQGRNHLLADLQEGDAFGEIALIDDVPRTASIISDGGCIVLVLKKEGFDRFSQSLGSPDRVKAMIRLTSFFRRHPLFSKLSVKDQAQLIDTFRFETITTGDEIPSDDENFYVIYSGTVRVDTGDDSVDTTLHADDCFGYGNGLGARYFAQEGTGLLIVKQGEFHNLIWEKLVEKPELFV